VPTKSDNIFNRRSDSCATKEVARLAATNARHRQNQKCGGRFQNYGIAYII
jgi:hypothetical protein